MASSDLIKAYQDQIIDFIDPMLLQLFPKTSQDKRFVCEAVEKALMMTTTCISPNLLLQKLELYVKHKNPCIRAKVSMCICRSVHRLGVKGIKEYGLDVLIQIKIPSVKKKKRKNRSRAFEYSRRWKMNR
jgi:hypothetical protein